MLTVAIGFIAFVCLMTGISNGAWLEVGIVVVAVLLLMCMAHNDRQETKAYINFRDYWADGGPDRE